jgi:hypothetical protein
MRSFIRTLSGHATRRQTSEAITPGCRESAVTPLPSRRQVLPRDANRPFYDGILACCHAAGLSPSIIELPDADLDRAILAAAATRDIALLPESVTERHCAPGVRFVLVSDEQATFATAVVTSRDTDHMPTVAFLRVVPALVTSRAVDASRGAIRSADYRSTAI